MVRMWLWLVAALAVVAVSTPALLADDVGLSDMGPVFGEQLPPLVSVQYGGPTPAQLTMGSDQPKMYDNTTICTVDVISLAVDPW